jgi:uncharacterized protein YdhG (YjbR/CyaY superfamily)
MGKPETVDEYIASSPADVQPLLRELRAAIRAAAPQAKEKLSYGMPYFHLNGRLTYFRVNAHHIGMYAFTLEDARAVGLEQYSAEKATLQFPLDQPLPVAAIRALVERRVASQAS